MRGFFKDNFVKKTELASEKMRFLLDGAIVEDRIFNNCLIPLSTYYTLSEHLELPWNMDDLFSMSVKLMIEQNRETKKNDDLGNFWKVIQFLISSNLLFEDGDYKLVTADRFELYYQSKALKRQCSKRTE